MELLAFCLVAYLAGSVNFSIHAFKLAGRGDPRHLFSGNPGTVNTYRALGLGWALVVLSLDLGRGLIVALLEVIAERPSPPYRAAAIYHLARAHERAGDPTQAALFFRQAKATAELDGDRYYALWAENGLRRLELGNRSSGEEGLSNGQAQTVLKPPRASSRTLASRLQPIGELHEESYPWIARATALLRVGERDAATAELFEAYLTWRHALGKPIARAGLTCVKMMSG